MLTNALVIGGALAVTYFVVSSFSGSKKKKKSKTAEIRLVHGGAGYARLQVLLRVVFRGVADEALLFGELVLKIIRIGPVEREDGRLAHVNFLRDARKSTCL